MFTGIIETTGIIKDIFSSGTNKTFWVQSALAHQLTIDQSVAHNGVCLTVEEVKDGLYRITAIEETLLKTNLTGWKINTVVNIERCMQMNGRIDGHIVQGHVDTVATCIENIAKDGSWEYQFEFDKKFGTLIIEKGSIGLNGISLTIFNVKENGFTVAIIPYTYHHTNMQYLKQGDKINIEFDMIGKYVGRIMELK
ncbi:riboflavin synthase [Ferruginibacter sp.]|uniref:riboflavin synthase n=1 Tax=Ferruginibacter sp. TaxID=1940288 RepID=UPI0019B46459|nr:riboflavin synthase [Ferruginibacter sp.]MBC7626698.1 riboflavin synthase [Ferruginibacter sp.]